jgi:hypothetical protein
MPDFLYNWSLIVLNFWHAHPFVWWAVVVLVFVFNILPRLARK